MFLQLQGRRPLSSPARLRHAARRVRNTAAVTSEAEISWEARFRAARVSLPEWAVDAPHRNLYVSNATGTWELYAWDRTTGDRRQVTDRPQGTTEGALDPAGEWIWWFDDTDGDEHGVWRRQPFAGGPVEVAMPDVPAGYSAGLAMAGALVAVGVSSDAGVAIHLGPAGGATTVVYASEDDADVVDLSRDGGLLCLEHSEHGDSRHRALRVLRTADGEPVGELWDGPGKGLHGMGFSPVPGDPRLLVVHERTGRPLPMIWDPVTGAETDVPLDLPGDLDADWYADGTALLVAQTFRARSALHRYDLRTGVLTALEVPAGTVMDATARPDGDVEFAWSSAAEPPRVRATSGAVVLTPPGPPPPSSVPVDDVDAEGPGGRVHALVARPVDGAAPYPAVFLIHGGPTWHDSDSFAADRATWVDHGFAVVHVNYRGSTGYGSPWRDAIEGRPGLTELEDIAAVRAHLVEEGIVDPERAVLAGGSWGGYLTLLGLGTQPDLWAVGVAAVPVADYVAAYEDEMEPLRAFDRSLFGGSPDDVPEVYERCSPITNVDAVRAPVLVLAGENDPRCPIRQVDNYLAALERRGAVHEVYRFDAGHGSLVVDERIRQMRTELDFVQRQLTQGR